MARYIVPHMPNASHIQSNDARIAVIGAGIIGLSIALSLSRRGAAVTVIEKGEVGKGASWAAAGMLAPAYEALDDGGVHPELLPFCLEAADMWKSFAPQLQEFASDTLDYGDAGALACAADEAQMGRLLALEKACQTKGVPCRLLCRRDARLLEPSLGDSVRGALLLPTDQQIDNWAVINALQAMLNGLEVPILTNTSIDYLEPEGEGYSIPEIGSFDRVVWAAGEASRTPVRVDGLVVDLSPNCDIIPVKGQMLAVEPLETGPSRVLRFGTGYVAPKSSRIVIGSTSEWRQADTQVTDIAIDALKEQASRICPALGLAETSMKWAGVRPGTKHHAPVIGWTHIPGIALAAGHYRNGILLGPITGEAIADLMFGGDNAKWADIFSPQREAYCAS